MKRLFLFLVILVTLFCITGTGTGIGNSSVDQAVSGDVTGLVAEQVEIDSSNVTQSVSSANETFILKNPTFQEMKDFVLADTTHRRTFIPDEYECRHFATDMVNNAINKGILAGFTLICYNQGQHAVVAFDTVDRGIIYIEPQTNAAISVSVGGTYQSQVIKEILIAW